MGVASDRRPSHVRSSRDVDREPVEIGEKLLLRLAEVEAVDREGDAGVADGPRLRRAGAGSVDKVAGGDAKRGAVCDELVEVLRWRLSGIRGFVLGVDHCQAAATLPPGDIRADGHFAGVVEPELVLTADGAALPLE